MVTRLLTLALAAALAAPAHAASIFDGDPVDPATGRAYAILPGVPLILSQPDRPNDYNPPIIDLSKRGDVDLVVRAAHLGVGPLMPPPVAVPPTAVAGGVRIAAGSEIPFTVIASSGGQGVGTPLVTTELDGLPVVVVAYADLDGDGIVGPTDADADGPDDDGRELQESDYVVGRQVAIFNRGTAQGTLAVWKGAPASAGGLKVVLGAVAYVGPFRPGYFAGSVPDGPGVATLMPYFPRLDPDRVVDGNGGGGRAAPDVRLGVELEPAFSQPVGDPVLGTPFALPTDGSSPTNDRAAVRSGPLARLAFVRPSSLASYPAGVEMPLHRGAGGQLLEPLEPIELADDGRGGGRTVHLVPVDLLDNVTDPPAGTTAILLAGPGLVITAPDTDGDPTRETVAVPTAAGIDVSLDDAGGAQDSGAGSTLTVVTGGFPTAALAVRFTAAGATTTTITTTTSTSTTTTLGGGDPGGPVIAAVAVVGQPSAFVLNCRSRRMVVAVVDSEAGAPPQVWTTVAVNGVPTDALPLEPGLSPPGLSLPPGPVFTRTFAPRPEVLGSLALTVRALDDAGRQATPATVTFPVVATAVPQVSAPALAPDTLDVGRRRIVIVSAHIADDCKVRSASVEVDAGFGFRRAGGLRDRGGRFDAVAGDGLFTGRARIMAFTPGTVAVRVSARNALGVRATSPSVDLRIVAP